MSMTVMAAAAAAVALAVPASASASVSTACPDVAHHENAAHDGRNCSTVPVNPARLWSVTLNGAAYYGVVSGNCRGPGICHHVGARRIVRWQPVRP